MADPVTMAIVSAAVSVVGTVQQASAQKSAGKAAAASANYQALQYESIAAQNKVQAGQERAASQRAAVDKRRQATLLASRAQAVGASGGGLDPSTVDIISDIDAEGEYGALGALYQGESQARAYEYESGLNLSQAGATRYGGAVANKNAKAAATGAYISGAGSFFGKYGSSVFGSAPASAPSYQPSQYGPYQLPWAS